MLNAKDADIQKYLPYFQKYLPLYEINTPARLRHFFAQIAQESGQLSVVSESLNYSATRLVEVWPNRFNLITAQGYARNPQKLANKVYSNRLGNGGPETNEGWLYRGRGLKQLTGKNNYRACSRDLFKDDRLVENPDLVLEPEMSVLTALWFWKANHLNGIADQGSVKAVTKIVNGGIVGLSDRQKFFDNAKTVFA